MNIGTAIRQYRLEQGLTLEQVALASGTDAANLSRLERGLQRFTPELLDRVADVLRIPVSSLYARVEQERAIYGELHRETGAMVQQQRQMTRLQNRFNRLTPASRKLVLDFLDLLLRTQEREAATESTPAAADQ